MDIREKLVELVAICPCESSCEGLPGSCPDRKGGFCNNFYKLPYCAFGKLVDHLIAHGVTVQEWIPLSEPPETNGCYLVAGNLRWDGKPMAREAYWRGDAWLSCDGKCYITSRITHWAHLPTPPKGE